MRVGDLVKCRYGTGDAFWYRDGVGIIINVIQNTWHGWEGPSPTHIIKVLWTDGEETTISTRWLEVISG